jgi:putative DNA primase/helicase
MNPAEEIRKLFKPFVPAAQVSITDATMSNDPAGRGEQAAEIVGSAAARPHFYEMNTWEYMAARPQAEYIVDGLIPTSALVTIVGASGSGKTFLVLDMCAHVACGLPWLGREVMPVPVTYVVLEAAAGITKRLNAWQVHMGGNAPTNILFIDDGRPFSLRFDEDVADLIASIVNAGFVNGLIVFDTFAAATAGADENSGKEMTLIVANTQRIKRETGCTVLIVHHTGKTEGKGMRGHTSMHAAQDVVIQLEREGAQRFLTVIKSREDIDGSVDPFRLRTMRLGVDRRGKEISSCVIDADSGVTSVRNAPRPGGSNQKLVTDKLRPLFKDSKDTNKTEEAPEGRALISYDKAIEHLEKLMPGDDKHRKQQAKTAISGLVARKYYGFADGWLWTA